MSDYVVLTKNINVEKIIQDNDDRKQYYAFFRIIREHCNIFKSTKKKLDDDTYEFILNSCYIDCKRWCHLNNKKFNNWHKTLCDQELQKILNYEYRILR